MSDLRAPTPLHLTDLEATRLVVILWGGMAVLGAGRLVGAAPLALVALVTALVAACSVRATRTMAVCVAGIGWALLNAFVVHRYGQLGFVGVGDVARAGLLLVVAMAVSEVRP